MTVSPVWVSFKTFLQWPGEKAHFCNFMIIKLGQGCRMSVTPLVSLQ